MQTPFKLEIRGIQPSIHLREMVAAGVAKLERRYGRITACRLSIRAPGRHHKMGEPYAVTLRLSIPDRRDVDVAPPPRALDHRQADLVFAVNDAFRRAARQLREQTAQLKGQVKLHAQQPSGKVLRVDPKGNFGFLESDDGREIYFHANSVLDGKFARLKRGSRVTFREEQGDKGPQASMVFLAPG